MSADKFQDKYRIPSARWQNWDYGNNAHYFVTINTKNKAHYFGKIMEKQMHLSFVGKLAEQYWLEIPVHFSFVKLDSFVIMPNHVHGIITIDKNEVGYVNVAPHRDTINRVSNDSTICNNSENVINTNNDNRVSGGITGNHNPMLYENLSRIIRWYKGRVTFEAKHNATIWQTRFHDHVIRDHHEYRRIVHYIETNVENWKDDQFYS